MTNLANKFSSFEEQLSTQHTEVMDALNTIAYAIGAPPTAPTTNLEDIYTQLTALIDGMALIYNANNTFHAALLDSVGLIYANTDIIITNNSLNAQRTIAAIYATFCDCVTDTPLISPPLDVTPTEIVDDAKCRRIQFYLSVFGNWLNKIANYGASGAAITSGTLSTLLAIATADAGIVATGVEVGAAGGIPGMVVGAVVGLIAVVAYTLGGSVLIDYANQFNDATLRDNMVMAMYAATNADEGYTAFKSTLLAGMDTIPAEIIYTLWWSAWSNDIYSGVPEVDDSAFDGSICAPAVEIICADSSSSPFVGGNYHGYFTSTALASFLGNGGSETLARELAEYTVTVVSSGANVELVSFSISGEPTNVQVAPCVVPKGTTVGQLVYAQSSQPFVIHVCANPNP
jgi:hypothetical protein